MAGKMKLSAAAVAAPVVAGEGDVFRPLRELKARYLFNCTRITNLVVAAHERIPATPKDDKPKAHARIKRLEKVRDYYAGAAQAVALLIPNRYEEAVAEA
jgi:hypothetical protein